MSSISVEPRRALKGRLRSTWFICSAPTASATSTAPLATASQARLKAEPPDDIRGSLLDELASTLAALGQLDEALRIRKEEELPVYEKLGDVRERAITLGKMADIFQARGELDEALNLWRTGVLPVLLKLEDRSSIAMAEARCGALLVRTGHPWQGARWLASGLDLVKPLRTRESEWIANDVNRLGMRGYIGAARLFNLVAPLHRLGKRSA